MKKQFVLIILICEFAGVFAQKTFNGSFLMTFKSQQSDRDYPLIWNIEKNNPAGKMGFEIQDELIKEGVSKRVIFNTKDSTWTMTIGFNNVKQGTRIRASAMYKDTIKQRAIRVTSPKEKRTIENYKCKKYIIESPDHIAEVWATDQLSFDICNVYKLLSHCGMLSKYVQRGDWYKTKNISGMILEVTSKKISTGEFYTMNVSKIKQGEVNAALFDITGYRISDIPEGQNCGPVEEE